MNIPDANVLLSHLNTTMQNGTTTDVLLGLNLSLSIAPLVTFHKATSGEPAPGGSGRFQISADATLQYVSFSRLLNSYLAGKRFDLSEGIFAKHVVVENVSVNGTPSHALLVRVTFTGSFSGSVTFTGSPVYNVESKTIVLLHAGYDLQTGNLLLQGAKLLFASRIEKELKKATRFSISQLLEQMQGMINENLNKEWASGIRGTGEVNDLQLLNVQALPEHLLVQATCEGSLQISISEPVLQFKR